MGKITRESVGATPAPDAEPIELPAPADLPDIEMDSEPVSAGLTEDEAREAAAVERLMAVGVRQQTGLAQTAAAPGGESKPAGQGEQPAGPGLADKALMAAPTGQAVGAALALKYGPAILDDLRKGAWELTLDPTDNQAVGALFDAANEIYEFTEQAGDWLGDIVKINPQLVLGEEDAEAAPFQLGPIGLALTEEQREAMIEEIRSRPGREEAGRRIAPEIAPGESVTSAVVRPLASFMAVMATTRRAAPGLLTGAKGLAGAGQTALAGGAASQVIAWEDGLANMVDELVDVGEDGLARDIVDFMKYDMDTPELERRLKMALEDAALGVGLDVLPSILKNIRRARSARQGLAEALGATDEAGGAGKSPDAPTDAPAGREAMQREAAASVERDIVNVLGDPAGELVTRAAARVGDEAAGPASLQARALGGVEVPITADSRLHVNLARIQAPEDIKGVIRQMVDAHAESVSAAKRGSIPLAETEASAADLDAFQIVLNRRQGQALNAEEITALRNLKVSLATRVRELAVKAEATGSTADLYAFERTADVYRAVMYEVEGATAEIARALSAHRIMAGGSRELTAAIDDFMTERGGAGTVRAMAGKLASLDPSQARELDELARTSLGGLGVRSVEEWFLNGLLLNPTTHIVNAMSNTATFMRGLVERAAVTRVARAIGKPEQAEVGEAAAMVLGAKLALHDAMRYAWKTFATGESGFGLQKVETGRGSEIAEMLRRTGTPGGISEVVGMLTTLSFRGLGASDEFFKTINYRAELYARAWTHAVGEARAGTIAREDVSRRMGEIAREAVEGDRRWEDIRLAARSTTQANTFTKPPRKGGLTEAILQVRRRIPIGGKVVFAFVNTPSNLIKDAWARTPLAPLMAEYRQAMREGGRAAIEANTKLAMGTAAMVMIADWANAENDQGLPVLTGGGPAEPELRAALARTGWQPYSVYAMGRYWSYRRTDPIGMLIGVVADLNEIVVNADRTFVAADEPDEWIAATAASIGSVMLEKSYLTGIADFLEVMSDPERYAPSYFDRLGATFATGNFTPLLRRWSDPNMRYTSDLLDEIKNRLPGFSKELPMRRDLWGRPIAYESGIGKVYDAFSPIYARTLDPEPIDREIIAQRFTGLGDPSKTLTFPGGESMSLRNRLDVWADIQERAGSLKLVRGRTLLELMNSIVTPPGEGGDASLHRQYMRLTDGPDGGKEQMLARFVQLYYGAAREQVARELIREDDPLYAESRRRAWNRRAPANRQMPEFTAR